MDAYSFDYRFARQISLVEVLVRSRKDEQIVVFFMNHDAKVVKNLHIAATLYKKVLNFV